MPDNAPRICLDLDDFGPKNTNLGLLEDLKDHYPNLKVTVFTVPWEIRFGEATPITQEQYLPFCNVLKKTSDWIEVALHGLTHAPREFESLSYEDAKKRIVVGEKMLINRGIPYAKLFKAPQWLLSPEAKKAAEDLGFTVVEDHSYNWNIKDDYVEGLAEVWGHGHVQDVMGNGLPESFMRLLQMPTNAKFEWVSERLKVRRVDPSKLEQEPKL